MDLDLAGFSWPPLMPSELVRIRCPQRGIDRLFLVMDGWQDSEYGWMFDLLSDPEDETA